MSFFSPEKLVSSSSFFFSSRRRHTRCYRDWSSDVCSSDLVLDARIDVGAGRLAEDLAFGRLGVAALQVVRGRRRVVLQVDLDQLQGPRPALDGDRVAGL